MLGFVPRESKSRESVQPTGNHGRHRSAMRVRRARVLGLEALEVRITPSTATWTGAGSDSNWTSAANWSGGVAPLQGDDLVFPAGATNLNAVDDFPVGTSFSSIRIGAPGYTL